MYISINSGHHQASLAVEQTLKEIQPANQVLNTNCLKYTNPILEKIVNRAYMGVIKNTPELWDYLYDNPKFLKNTQKLRDFIHRYNSKKLKILLDKSSPDVIACTQAFPCGMVADYKKYFDLNIPLVGILTDHAPHSYWVYDTVDFYIVPSEQSKNKFISEGIAPEKIKVWGIPIDTKFEKNIERQTVFDKLRLNPTPPIVLIMGGGQGLGPIEEVVWAINNSNIALQLIVATGTNRLLYKNLRNKQKKFKKQILILDHVNNIDELMEISTLIITKPGGLTTAEALSKGLPIIIINPIPGQENRNTRFLINEGIGVKAENEEHAVHLLTDLLKDTDRLNQMRLAAKKQAKPDAARKIAQLLLNL